MNPDQSLWASSNRSHPEDYNCSTIQLVIEMKRYFLRTERLGFAHWSAGDLPLALALWGDPKVMRFIGGPFTNEEIRDRLDIEIALSREYKVQYWPIFLLENQEHAGCAGLRPYRIEDLVYELGIHLRSPYWGRGLAEEAGRAVIKFAFEDIGANALFAGHHPANSASQRLLLKLSFRATHEEFYAPTGLNHPSYLLTSALRPSRSTPKKRQGPHGL